jgi:pyruvate-formate lyase-activating enzyme
MSWFVTSLRENPELVPGWSAEASEIAGVARFAAGLGNVERVDVLPFHQMGRFKWEVARPRV